MATKKKVCSFCGRAEDQVKLMISGLDGFICEDCAQQAYSIVQSMGLTDAQAKAKNETESKFSLKRVPKPKEIKKYLDQYIIGQDEAKRYLSVSVYNHYKRLEQPRDDNGVEIEKSNIIMVGSTGPGKTFHDCRRDSVHGGRLCWRGCGEHSFAPSAGGRLRCEGCGAGHRVHR